MFLVLLMTRGPEAKGPADAGDSGLSTGRDLEADGSPALFDCDDADPSRHPSAEDPPRAGVDQDSDGEDLGAVAGTAWRHREGGLRQPVASRRRRLPGLATRGNSG
jgi:hypothetical protein